MKKRITAIVMAALMLTAMVPFNTIPVFAEETSPEVVLEDATYADVNDDADASAEEVLVEPEADQPEEFEITLDPDDYEVILNESTDEEELLLNEVPAADGDMYTREAKLMAGLPGVYATKAYPGEKQDTATMGIPSVSKNKLTLENGPTTETPAMIMGAAVGYEIKTGPVSYEELKPRIAPYSYFRYGIIEEQNHGEQGASGTHKKLSGFDGSYYIIRVDVSEIIKKYIGEDGMQGDGKFLHVKQADNKALMVAAGIDRSTFSDALGNKTGSYSLANNAAALKDTDGDYQDTPYFDVILMSSGKLAAGADAGSETAPSGDVKLSFYVDDVEDYAPEIVPLDPQNMPTFPYKVTVGGKEVTFQTEQDYNKALLAKFFDDTKATEENNAASYNVKGSDLEIDVTVDEQEEGESTPAEFWSLTKAIDYMPYNDHVIKLICEVPVLEGLSVKGDISNTRKINFDVNSFDIQIANNNEQDAAKLSVGEFVIFRLMDGTNTSGAELAIGNNATMEVLKDGIMYIDKSCTLEVEYDAATITDPTQQQSDAVNGEITVRNGGILYNEGVINIEGSEAKPLQPSQQEQEAGQTVITDMQASDMMVEEGGILFNFGCMSIKGNLYNMGELYNYGRYNDILETHDPDKGTKSYHRGIQVTWKDDVTQEGVKPGGMYIGYAGNEQYNADAALYNIGDIVLAPGELHVFGKFINQENPEIGYLYICDADEAVIPITPDPATPTIVEKRVTIDPPKESVYRIHEEKNAYVENRGRIGKAKVKVVSNGVLGDLTPLEWTDLSKAEITLENAELVYTGENQTAKVTSVKLGDKTLVENTDYVVEYSHKYSKKPGEYYVYIIGINAYGGEAKTTYKIVEANLENAEITLSAEEYTYTGKALEPEVTVKIGDATLVKDTDYTVAYSNNTNVGTAKVEITGIGSCTGTVTKTFQIKDKAITGLTLPKTYEVPATKTDTLTPTFKPSNTSQTALTWKSSDTSIVTVDQNGKIKGLKRGTATITATSKANSSYKATCKVTVKFLDAYYNLNGTGESNVTEEMETAINWAADKKITGEDQKFGTKSDMTRGQFVRFLYRYAGNPKVTSTMIKKYGSQFKDIDKSYTHYKAIVWAVSKGLIAGYSDGTFKPEKTLTRTNVATILWKYAGSPKVKNANKPFSDVAKSAAIAWGKSKKIFTGSKFQPKANCLRGDFALFLYRYDKAK